MCKGGRIYRERLNMLLENVMGVKLPEFVYFPTESKLIILVYANPNSSF